MRPSRIELPVPRGPSHGGADPAALPGDAARGRPSVKRVVLLASVLMGGPTTAALADYNVSGTCAYVDREFDENGFTGSEPVRPVRLADVQVIDGSKIVGTGVTDNLGNFS